MSGEKKKLVELPLKIILSERGTTSFMGKSKKVMRFMTAEDVEEYGVLVNQFSPKSVQTMILMDYVQRLEISMPEFVTSRQEVMDLSKLIVFSLLYKSFDREVYSKFVQTDMVKAFNRKNPTHLIDEKTRMNEKELRFLMKMKHSMLVEIRKDIIKPVWEQIENNADYSLAEKNSYMLMCEKFMNTLSIMNWYLLMLFSSDDKFQDIVSVIRALLISYMAKSSVAEYISVMLMELAVGSENMNMKLEALRLFPDEKDTNKFILQKEVRNRIIDSMKERNMLVTISWRMGGSSLSIGKQGRMQIALYNKTGVFTEVKEEVEAGFAADNKKKSLIDFYKDSNGGGTDLGMYYLSYLDDECKKVNIKFDSLVSQYSDDLTVIKLSFNL